MSKILMVASEAAPFAKTGGLADVLGALPAALVARGDEVMVLLPAYGSANLAGAERYFQDLPVWMTGGYYQCAIDRIDKGGVPYLFLNCPPLYGRNGYYGDRAGGDYGDNHVRFAVLSRAAITVAARIFRPDIIHCHDWQASLTPVYLKTAFRHDPTFHGIKTILTIHNLGYQGQFSARAIHDIGVDPGEVFHINGLEYYGNVNLLKGGINY